MYYIISNPFSGRQKKTNRKTKCVFEYLDANNIQYELFETKYVNHPFEIAKQLSKDHEEGGVIIVIGGDGTLSEVINGLDDLSKWNIGIIPAGSGNDFASCLGIEFNPMPNLLTILNGRLETFDYININNKKCLNILGTGIDVEVLKNFERHKKLKGKFRYFYSLVEALLHVKWHEFDVSLDDGKFVHKEGFIITVCNGKNFGGGIPICPGADPQDGKLEFVYVDKMKKSHILGHLLKLMKGKVYEFKETEHVYCTKAVFRSPNNITIQVDGNITSDTNVYECNVVKNGIKIYK